MTKESATHLVAKQIAKHGLNMIPADPDRAMREACSGHPQAMVRWRQYEAVVKAAQKICEYGWEGTDLYDALKEGKWLP